VVEVGDTAPNFALTGTQWETIEEFTLPEFSAGRPTMLIFYVSDFSPVCSTQLCEVTDMELLTFNDDVAMVGISPDGPYSHRQFSPENDRSFTPHSSPTTRRRDTNSTG
jgi:peroxiredoxin Q/BCP